MNATHHPSTDGPDTTPIDLFLGRVEACVRRRLDRVVDAMPGDVDPWDLISGKMLRSRLVAALRSAGYQEFDTPIAVAACAATELVHSASLCHDDVIDRADVRRGRPTVWRVAGIPGAILVGDLLLVSSYQVLSDAPAPGLFAHYSETLTEVCTAEMRQELQHRGAAGDDDRWIATCRGKTGALFAFPARWAFHRDPEMASAVEEAAALIGCAWQMFDDLLDVIGDEAASGKTLGTDRARQKFTVPGGSVEHGWVAIDRTLAKSLDEVARWPGLRAALAAYVAAEMTPHMRRLR